MSNRGDKWSGKEVAWGKVEGTRFVEFKEM